MQQQPGTCGVRRLSHLGFVWFQSRKMRRRRQRARPNDTNEVLARKTNDRTKTHGPPAVVGSRITAAATRPMINGSRTAAINPLRILLLQPSHALNAAKTVVNMTTSIGAPDESKIGCEVAGTRFS